MEDVAIVGVGMHPFGRFGAKSAIDMAAEAVRAACADAGRNGRTSSSPSAAAPRSTTPTR